MSLSETQTHPEIIGFLLDRPDKDPNPISLDPNSLTSSVFMSIFRTASKVINPNLNHPPFDWMGSILSIELMVSNV